ncbi:MAG: sulfatase-like hydrolase/transferase [bacterium]|nr:sulfatase-like hydrolase/transferase [bacterium]
MKKQLNSLISKAKGRFSKFEKRLTLPIRKFAHRNWQKFAKKFPKSAKFFSSQRFWKTFLFLLKFGALILAGINGVFYIFFRQYGAENATKFILEHPEITGYSTLIMLILIFLYFGFLGSTTWTIGIYYISLIVLMFINQEKMASRNTPFMREDLAMTGEAGSLLDMVNLANLWSTIWQILAIIVACLIISKILKKLPRYHFSLNYRLLAQILIVVGSGTLLAYHTDFLRTQLAGKGTVVDVEWLNSKIDFTNAAWNYESNGFVVGTISTLQTDIIPEPENYSKEKIEEIIAKYSKIAAEQNQQKAQLGDEKINIVYVMSESFADPEPIKKLYYYSENDPIPFTHQVIRNYTSGQTATAEYGGGTANVEFEALTGLSNYFINGIPYSYLVSNNSDVPSLPKTLKKAGYQITAIHPYKSTMYQRNTVYPRLGFENFIDETTIENPARLGNSSYISDESAFNQVISTIEKSEKADFIHLVTMQNHMPYGANLYNEQNFPTVNLTNGEKDEAWTTYIEGISKSDEAMRKFIEKLENSNEKTMVIFWGDHWPGLLSAFDLTEAENSFSQHTPLFIYSNFETEKHELGAISLNYLQTKVLQQINAQISPFQALISANVAKNPALTKKREANQTAELSDYELIEYDILSGKKYSAQNSDFFGY